jgi:hypothetical protein
MIEVSLALRRTVATRIIRDFICQWLYELYDIIPVGCGIRDDVIVHEDVIMEDGVSTQPDRHHLP